MANDKRRQIMNDKQDIDLKPAISKDKAIELLFSSEKTINSDPKCFDEFGNYVFPTDMVANTPNTAIGTSVGLAFIDGLCLK